MTSRPATLEAWSAFLGRCSRVNLLQTWSYGEAKRAEGWDPQRVLLGPGPDASVQILYRRLPLVGCVARINRGPLVAVPFETDRQRWCDALRWIHAEIVVRRGATLSIAPELSADGTSADLLRRCGFVPPQRPGWRSAVLDLASEETTLRKTLGKKWRNCLSKAERSGLSIAEDQSASAIARFLETYVRFRESKGFEGPGDLLVRSLAAGSGDAELKVLTAGVGSEPVAGIIVVKHGDAATYLLSWNSPEGRRLSANYALLWSALVSLKREAVRWFDVGGLDPEGLPGISEFKLGLRPALYTLIGECWAYPPTLRGWVGRVGAKATSLKSMLAVLSRDRRSARDIRLP